MKMILWNHPNVQRAAECVDAKRPCALFLARRSRYVFKATVRPEFLHDVPIVRIFVRIVEKVERFEHVHAGDVVVPVVRRRAGHQVRRHCVPLCVLVFYSVYMRWLHIAFEKHPR